MSLGQEMLWNEKHRDCSHEERENHVLLYYYMLFIYVILPPYIAIVGSNDTKLVQLTSLEMIIIVLFHVTTYVWKVYQ